MPAGRAEEAPCGATAWGVRTDGPEWKGARRGQEALVRTLENRGPWSEGAGAAGPSLGGGWAGGLGRQGERLGSENRLVGLVGLGRAERRHATRWARGDRAVGWVPLAAAWPLRREAVRSGSRE